MAYRGPGLRTVQLDLQYQNTIPGPPASAGDLWEKATSGDTVTIDTWRKQWVDQYKHAAERFGNFGDKTVGKLYKTNLYKPAICLGSGPSLKHTLDALKENRALENPVLTVSCLHNFALLEDNECHADYYVTLDAGDVVMHDTTELGGKDAEHYWEKTEGKTLIAYVASPPALWEKWRGDVYLFNCMVPDDQYRKQTEAIQVFRHYVSSGGNCLGACVYIAKAIMGSNPIIFAGADFSFDYDNTFHPVATKYDNFNGKGIGGYLVATDVFGVTRKTWPSYYNFKCFFDNLVQRCPGEWINCSEGILGAYKEGNIEQFKYMTLSEALLPYKIVEHVFYAETKPDGTAGEKEKINWREVWAQPEYKTNLVLY